MLLFAGTIRCLSRGGGIGDGALLHHTPEILPPARSGLVKPGIGVEPQVPEAWQPPPFNPEEGASIRDLRATVLFR